MGSCLGFGLVVWGFSGVILGHFKPYIARLVGLIRGYVESTWGLAYRDTHVDASFFHTLEIHIIVIFAFKPMLGQRAVRCSARFFCRPGSPEWKCPEPSIEAFGFLKTF